MKLRKLGKQGPEVSVIGYGAWEIGGEAYGPNSGDDDVVAAIHSAIDSGINWIDTAEIYGKGNSERLVGLALTERRDDVLVATKVGPKPFGSGFEPGEVRGALEKSLARLRTDRVDLYQLHWYPDEDDWPIEDTWAAMAGLVEEGLVKHIGVSNFTIAQIERCMKVRHVDSLQPQFSMLHRNNDEVIAFCERSGIGTVVYGPLAYGLLSGKIGTETKFDPSDWRSGKDPNHSYYVDLFAPGKFEKNLDVVERLRPIARSEGVELSQLVLAWTTARAGVTSAIAGSRSTSHIASNAAAGEINLSHETIGRIDQALAAK